MNNSKINIVKSVMKLLRIMFKNEKVYFLYVFLNIVSSGLFAYTLIQIPKIVLTQLETNHLDLNSLIFLFSLLTICGIGSVLMKYLYTPIGFKIRYNLLADVIETMLSIPLSDFENPKYLDNMWIITSTLTNPSGIQAFYTEFANFCGNFSCVIVAAVLLAQVNTILTIIVLLWSMIFLTLVVKKNIKSNKINMEHSRLFREQRYLGDIARDSKYAKEIRVFQLTNWINSKKIKVIKELICLTKKISKYTFALEVVDIVYQLLRDYFMYIVLIILYFNHKITIAEIASFSVLVMQLNANLSLLSVNFESMFNQFSSLDLLFEYLDIEKEPVGVSSNKKSEDWSITFDSVSFHYPNNDYLIFENLSFTIEKGKKIAIIGLNGVGKTTLIKLLMRLYKPTSGRILINGTNIEEFKPGDYYCLFAPVFQEMNLFPFTFFENLTFRDDCNDEMIVKIQEILKQVGLFSLYNTLPKGMDTNMTRYFEEDGILLSGGQMQKFSLTRALVSNREILILDEPTSALDAIAEYEFYEKINHEFKDKTILFISHRLASTDFCEEIFLIEDKTIKERGTHKYLMSLNGRYKELFEIQAKNYKEEVGQ